MIPPSDFSRKIMCVCVYCFSIISRGGNGEETREREQECREREREGVQRGKKNSGGLKGNKGDMGKKKEKKNRKKIIKVNVGKV